jgi:hypothetical protein
MPPRFQREATCRLAAAALFSDGSQCANGLICDVDGDTPSHKCATAPAVCQTTQCKDETSNGTVGVDFNKVNGFGVAENTGGAGCCCDTHSMCASGRCDLGAKTCL